MLSTSDQKSAHKFHNIDVIYYKLLVMKNKCNMQLACMQKPYNIALIRYFTVLYVPGE